MTLTDPQLRALKFLVDRGGRGFFDGHGRMVAQGEQYSQGAWKAWLKLLCFGCIEGKDGIVTLTDYGRAKLTVTGAEAR